jgi:hypothetical protein
VTNLQQTGSDEVADLMEYVKARQRGAVAFAVEEFQDRCLPGVLGHVCDLQLYATPLPRVPVHMTSPAVATCEGWHFTVSRRRTLRA